MLAVAGAAALFVTTGFISSEATEIVEESEELFVEIEEEAFLGTTYRKNTCEGRGGNCLPTFCCVETKE